MKIKTRYFGEIEVSGEKYIHFKEGIPGFEELKQFVILEGEENTNLYYLQSVEDGDICFPIMNPYDLVPDYAPEISETYFEQLGGGQTDEYTLYNIITIRDTLEDSTMNLQGPLLIHLERRVGIQVVVEGQTYKTRHSILGLINQQQMAQEQAKEV